MQITGQSIPYSNIMFFVVYNKTKQGFHGGGVYFDIKKNTQTAHWYTSYAKAEKQIETMNSWITTPDEYIIIHYTARAVSFDTV